MQNRRRLAEGTLVAIEDQQQEVVKVQKHGPCAPYPTDLCVRWMVSI